MDSNINSVTNCILQNLITDKTDKTCELDNNIFLQKIFGEIVDKARPIIVSFQGNPSKISKKNWLGNSWKEGCAKNLPNDANNYFSLATFKPDKAGNYRRKKSQFQALHAIMLDDIGSKVPIDRISLQPSWLLETSPDNYQAGYLLSKPIVNIKHADQLMNAIINTGLSDPGSNGPATRLARLPIAINGKHKSSFSCQLTIWHPHQRYSVNELINGLQLEIIENETSKSKKSSLIETDSTDTETILIPRPKVNAVVIALHQRNLYKSPLGSGRYDITCPWFNEHTDRIDSGTAYFEPDDNYPLGGFKCQHGHCNKRHIRDLLHFLEVDINSARMKPTIRVIKGEIHRVVDIAEQELASTQQYYQRGGMIVSIYTDPSTKETFIQNVSQPALVRALSGIATWEQFDLRSKKLLRIDPPARHASILFDSKNYRHLPLINGITRQPYLRPDGTLMQLAGYDINTGLFGVFDSRKFSIPNKSTKKNAESSLKLLNELLSEFCFATKNDLSAALSAILTAAIRPSLPHAPMFHVRAHTVGSGKSYLCGLITTFATPQQGTPITFPGNDEECQKLLFSELLRAPAVIEFDNLTTDILPHNSLCTSLTSEFITSRILGLSKTISVSTRSLLLSSGNNVGPIKDMTRRCITINLNPEVEIPASRTYQRTHLIQEVLKERERYVSAAITIIRAWIITGMPKTKCNPLSGFDRWSDLCRQSLLWLGHADPALSVFEAIKKDPERELLARLLKAWQAVFGKTPAMVRKAVNRSQRFGKINKELSEILHNIADEDGKINHHVLGRWIKRKEGQIVEGLRFIRSTENFTAQKWKVESVSSVLSVSLNQDEEIVKERE